jgi:predicted nucleic acid-binding protein
VVVDASVAVKWFVAEAGLAAARSLLETTAALHAPSLMRLEVANAVLRAGRRGHLTLAKAEEALAALMTPIVIWADMEPLVPAAIGLAHRHGGTAHDAIYTALADKLRCPLATFDRRMAEVARAAGVTVHLLA